MHSSKKLIVIQALRVRRERTATLALKRSESIVHDIEKRRSEIARQVAETERRRLDVYGDLPASITRSDLYALKRKDSFLEHELIQHGINARALENQLKDAMDTRQLAQIRVSQTHQRVGKIDHVRTTCRAREVNALHLQEENEMEEAFIDS
jgi:hypothetical protein